MNPLPKGGVDLGKGGMNPLPNYDFTKNYLFLVQMKSKVTTGVKNIAH